MSNIDGVFKMLAEVLARLDGHPVTRLSAPLSATGTTALAESTLAFPDDGVLSIEGEQIPYTGRLVDRFTGLVRDPEHAVLHPENTGVEDASGVYSQLDRLRNDRLVRRADGVALDRLAWNHGERRPLNIGDTLWRSTLRILLYLERGLRWSLYRVLREVLSGWARTGTATTNLGSPTQLTVAPGWFSPQDVGRPLEIAGRVYQVKAVQPVGGGWCLLQPVRGPWWCAGSIGDGNDVDFTLMPFRILELPVLDPGYVQLDVYLPASQLPPAGYILEGIPAAVSPPGWTIGMQVLNDEFTPGTGYDPWYLPGISPDSAFAVTVEDVLAAGIDARLTGVAT